MKTKFPVNYNFDINLNWYTVHMHQLNQGAEFSESVQMIGQNDDMHWRLLGKLLVIYYKSELALYINMRNRS